MREARRFIFFVFTLAALAANTGCGSMGGDQVGSGGGGVNLPTFDFEAPPTVAMTRGSAQNLSINVTGQNGFAGSATITVAGLPSGVTVSPSSLVIPAGSSGAFQISAASDANVGQAQLVVHAVSGTIQISHNTSLLVTILPISRPYTTVGGWIQRAYYDESRQLLFATNTSLNEIDVLSGTDLTVHARVLLPQPLGIDQMPDGKTLVVGSLTQGIYTVNEDTLSVTPHLAPTFPGTPPFAEMLKWPVAMANGKVLIAGQDEGFYNTTSIPMGNGGERVIEWDSSTNLFSDITQTVMPNTTTPGLIGIKRSADHKWAIFKGDNLYRYSSDTDTFFPAQIPSGAQFEDSAANQDGTQFAVAAFSGTTGQNQVIFFDQGLNVLGTVNTSLGNWYNGNMMYSPDGSRLYWQLGISELIIDVIDTRTFMDLGSVATAHLGQTSEGLLWVDSNQRAFVSGGGWSSGVGTLDCSSLHSGAAQSVNGSTFTPSVIPLNASVPVSLPGDFNIPPGSVVTFAGVPANVQSYNPFSVIPAMSSVPGPVNADFTLPDGGGADGPLLFSYGTDVVASTATLLPPQGSPTISLFGFGMFDSSLGPISITPPTVTIGGRAASSISANSGQSVIQQISASVPTGSPGPADITVTSAFGSSTLKNAIAYIPSATIIPASGLIQLLYDSRRNLLFALKNTEVDVLDPTTLHWNTPLRPGGTSGTGFAAMTLTPDGTSMLVVDSANSTLTKFNPDNPSQSSVVQLALQPQRVVVTSTGKAYIVTGDYAMECDVPTLVCTQQQNGLYIRQASITGTPDGKHLVTCCNFRGSVGVWNSANDSFSAQQDFFIQIGTWSDMAVSPDGSMFVALYGLPGYAGVLGAFFDSQLHFLNALVYPDLAFPDGVSSLGALFTSSGKTLVVPLGDSIDFTDTATGRLRGRLMTPEYLPVLNYPIAWSGNIALDPTEQNIYAISASGLTVLKLPTPVDQLIPPAWPY